MIKLIWAQTKDGIIGKENQLPWKIPQEMQHFRQTTNQKNILMGSKTFASLKNQPLKNRQNYVLTKNIKKYQDLNFSNLHFLNKIAEVITKYQNSQTEDIYVIGGNEIFQLFFPFANEIIRTIIYQNYDGDLKIKDFDFSDFNLKKVLKEKDFEVQYFERERTMGNQTTKTKPANPQLEAKVQENDFKKQKGKKENKVYLDPWKMLYMWPAVLSIKRKAKKISKKNLKDPNTFSEEYRYHWIKKVVNRMIYVMNVDVKVEGIENWLDKGVVLVPNHESNFDPALLIAINDFEKQQPVAFIAKEELWYDKMFGRFMNLIDAIPLDRNSPRSALEAFKEAKELIVDYKRSLVIFPEGTRSESDQIQEFQPASLKVAQMSNAPVIPVTIIGSHQVFKPNRPKRVEVKVIFGKPILPTRHISLKTADLTRNVQREVETMMEKWKDKELTYELKRLKKQKSKKNETEKKKTKKSFKDLFKIVE